MLTSAAYKMRMHIAKSLQACCAAIHKAVDVYNRAASSLIPPRPLLDWTIVSHYSFLDKFNLLRDTQQDIHTCHWTEPAVRATMKQDLRVKQAHKEIIWCNVEIHHLHTSIHDKHAFFANVLCKLKDEQSLLFGPVEDYIICQHHINAHLQARISQVQSLPGFTGDSSIGVRKGSVNITLSDNLAENLDDEDDRDAVADAEPDDAMSGDIAVVVEYMAELPL